MKLRGGVRARLRNCLPESAQGFLNFGQMKYYDALSFAGDVLLVFSGNILKTSALNSR